MAPTCSRTPAKVGQRSCPCKVDMTLDFKRSDEYKELYRAIKSEKPDLPDYLVDLAIAFHKMHPTAYRDRKLQRQEGVVPPRASPDDLVLQTVEIM